MSSEVKLWEEGDKEMSNELGGAVRCTEDTVKRNSTSLREQIARSRIFGKRGKTYINGSHDGWV
jgi:hypothetical protein